MKILIQPFAQKLRNGMPNPKTFPFWRQLVAALPEHDFLQIGVKGEENFVNNFRMNASLQEIEDLLIKTDLWISVDSFLQHLAYTVKKPGIVIWSLSDPLIFGYKQNINLLKDRSYLRAEQFRWWEDTTFNLEAFPSISDIVREVHKFEHNRGIPGTPGTVGENK